VALVDRKCRNDEHGRNVYARDGSDPLRQHARREVGPSGSFDRGYDHTSLSTDSRTGALTLYERVGMRVTRSFTNWAIDL